MALVKKKKKTGSVAYAIFLTLWITFLALVIIYVLKALGRFEGYWEAAEITPVIDDYMDTATAGLVSRGLAEEVRQLDHPFQTEEQCLEYVQKGFVDDIKYRRSFNYQGESKAVYDVYCGQKLIGHVTLAQDTTLPDDLPIIQKYVKEFNLYPWEVVEANFEFDVEEFTNSIRVTAPADYTVLINDIPVSKDYIVEEGIHFDLLEDYYESFPDLPTKVVYEVDGLFGSVELSYLDAHGNPATIDPNKDDSQFVETVTGARFDRLFEFAWEFSHRYLEFSAGTGELNWAYDRLNGYVKRGSELDERLKQMMEGYAGWQHNKRFRFENCNMTSVLPLGGGVYVLEVTAKANCIQPVGTVVVERNLRIYVRYQDEKDDVLAFSCEDF